MKNKTFGIFFLLIGLFIISISMISAFNPSCSIYDDFSSGTLNTDKWEIRQDVEGQPFMNENWTDPILNNFHTQQNSIADRRSYLFQKKKFTTGDILRYDSDVLSGQGTYANMVLLTGDQYIRIGMRGPAAGFDELGVAYMELEFQENNLHITRETPSQVILIDNLALSNPNGTYEFYIGAFSGSNGMVHMDFDNFEFCTTIPLINFSNPTTNSGNYSQNFIESIITFSDEVNLDTGIISLYDSSGLLVQSSSSAISPLFFNFTGLPDGTYYLNASVNDTSGNTNQTETRTIILDTTAPTLTNIQATSITTSSATISWDTNESSNSSVYYGLVSNETTSIQSLNDAITSHSISLSGLSASTLYYYNVSSCDALGNCNISTQYSFTTSANDGGGGGGGGGSSTKYYSCSKWNEWSVCFNGNQNRTCETKQIATSLTKTALYETKACTIATTPITGSATEELEESNTNNEEDKESTQKSESFRAGITGAVTGFSKTKGGKIFLIVVGVLAVSWIVLAVRRKFK